MNNPRNTWLSIFSVVCTITAYAVSARSMPSVYDVVKYGAVGDGKTLNTIAIQKAIDECSSRGGGVVLFPEGRYVSGTILLKNGVTLFLSDSTVLLGSTNINDYKMIDPFRTGNGALMGYCFIGAVDASNVGITGSGIIDGRGKPLLDGWGKEKRPFLVRFVRCTGIVVSDVHLTNAAAWTSHFFACRNIDIQRVSIVSKGLSNNDGFDIDCSQDVKIAGCNIDSGDDGLCLKTTWSGMACKNIAVSDLHISSNQSAIKFGTESMAAFENITISNIYIYDTRNGGIKLNTVDGAHMHDIEISDITMKNVRTPILLRLGSRLSVFRKDVDTQQSTGTMQRVTIRNVKATAAADAQLRPPTAVLITGVPGHPIENLTLENIEIRLPGGGTVEDSRHGVPEAVDQYPEVRTFGPTIPAYGIWARHVTGLKLNNIRLSLDSSDVRPAFVIDDGEDIEISNGLVSVSGGTLSVVRLENVNGARIGKMIARGNARAFVKVEGGKSNAIVLMNNNIDGTKKPVELSSDVPSTAVVIQ